MLNKLQHPRNFVWRIQSMSKCVVTNYLHITILISKLAKPFFIKTSQYEKCPCVPPVSWVYVQPTSLLPKTILESQIISSTKLNLNKYIQFCSTAKTAVMASLTTASHHLLCTYSQPFGLCYVTLWTNSGYSAKVLVLQKIAILYV